VHTYGLTWLLKDGTDLASSLSDRSVTLTQNQIQITHPQAYRLIIDSRAGFSWWEVWGPVAKVVAKVMQARIGYRITGF